MTMSCVNILYRTKNADTPHGDPTNVHGDFHINYWKLPKSRSSYNRAIDFGVYIEDATNILESISLTVPFNVTKENIIDLSGALFDENFLSYFFNGNYQVITLKDCPTYRYAKDRNGLKSFCVYELCQNSIEVQSLTRGTLITIKFLSYPKNLNEIQEKTNEGKTDEGRTEQLYNLYFRFRVKNLKEGDLCFTEDISNDFLQSAFSRSEMSHLKVNELREMDHSDIQELLSKNSFVSLEKFHFYFIGSSEDESVSGSTPYHSCALLEPSIWKNYIDNLNPFGKKCISYHWQSYNVEKHNVFFKTVYSYRNWKKMTKYAFIVVVLSLLASLILECGKLVYVSINKCMTTNDTSKCCTCIRNDNVKKYAN